MHAIVYYLLQHTPSETLSETPQGQIAPEVAGVRWDSDLMVRGLREGLHRHGFIAALEEEMSTFLNESLPLLQLNTADAYFSAMDSLVIKVAQRFFKRGVQDPSPELEALKLQRIQLLERRRQLRAHMVDAEHQEEFDSVVAQLEHATKECRTLNRRLWKSKEHAMIEELWECWRQRRMAECHRLLKQLGKSRGPKHRSYSSLRAALRSQQEWMHLWAREGAEGGMRASCADWNQMLEEHISCAPPLPEADMNHSKKAKEDVSRLKYHVLKAGKRKSSPWHSIPTEILGMILAPDYRLHEPGNVARLGLGINREEKLEAPSTRAAFIAGYTLLNRCSFTPLKWHASWGAALCKQNGKKGAASKRVVHRLDEQGKAFFLPKNEGGAGAETIADLSLFTGLPLEASARGRNTCSTLGSLAYETSRQMWSASKSGYGERLRVDILGNVGLADSKTFCCRR